MAAQESDDEKDSFYSLENSIIGLHDDGKISDDQHDNVIASIANAKKEINNPENKKAKNYKESYGKVVDITNRIEMKAEDLVSNDPLKQAQAAMDIAATASTVLPGVGPIIGAGCGILAAVLSLFGGKSGPSLAQQMADIVKDALDEFKNDDINENFESAFLTAKMAISVLDGISNYNGSVLVNPDVEGPILASLDYAKVGLGILGQLQYQVNTYKSNKDMHAHPKKQLAKYLYYWCVIFQMKRVVLTLQCSLLKCNKLYSVFNGIWKYLSVEMVREGTSFLQFLGDVPDSSWGRADNVGIGLFYREIHSLSLGERQVIGSVLKLLNIEMAGKLVIINSKIMGDLCIIRSRHGDIGASENTGDWRVGSQSMIDYLHDSKYKKVCWGKQGSDYAHQKVHLEDFHKTSKLIRMIPYRGKHSGDIDNNVVTFYSIDAGQDLFITRNISKFHQALLTRNLDVNDKSINDNSEEWRVFRISGDYVHGAMSANFRFDEKVYFYYLSGDEMNDGDTYYCQFECNNQSGQTYKRNIFNLYEHKFDEYDLETISPVKTKN